MTRRSTDYEAIEAEIDRIRSLGLDDLPLASSRRSSIALTVTGLAKTLPYSWAEQERSIRLLQ